MLKLIEELLSMASDLRFIACRNVGNDFDPISTIDFYTYILVMIPSIKRRCSYGVHGPAFLSERNWSISFTSIKLLFFDLKCRFKIVHLEIKSCLQFGIFKFILDSQCRVVKNSTRIFIFKLQCNVMVKIKGWFINLLRQQLHWMTINFRKLKMKHTYSLNGVRFPDKIVLWDIWLLIC